MKVWMIWLQGDDTTWLEGAMDDDTTAESGGVWEEMVDNAAKLAHDNKYVMRIQAVEVPGVFDLFEIPTVQALASKENR